MRTELTERGNLRIIATDEERADLRDTPDYPKREQLVCEGLHERYDFIAPEWIGALTDAPIFCASDDHYIADSGAHVFARDARIYWFPNYAITDPWETLAEDGAVVFTAAR